LAREADCAEKLRVNLLRRIRATPTQGGLNAAQRRSNVRGAFAVRAGQEAGMAGTRIVLVDDVYTTGATL
jgi:predicted amidophosphoribosyltransferase